MKVSIFYPLAIAALASLAQAAATCYYPDGSTTEPNHKPCNTTITNSACCDPLDACTTSGLCLGRTAFNYRGSCTDSTWQDPACPTVCHSDPSSKLPYSDFTLLLPCDSPGGQSTDFCCAASGNCCTIATFKYGTTGEAFKGGMDQLLLEASQANSSSTLAPVTITITATASAGIASSTSAADSSKVSLNSSSKSSNLGPIIGAAVGAPLGILAFGLLGFLFWRARRDAAPRAPASIELSKPYPGPDYYTPQPPQQPTMEAQTWQTAQAELSRHNTTNSTIARYDRKSPGINAGPEGVHELI